MNEDTRSPLAVSRILSCLGLTLLTPPRVYAGARQIAAYVNFGSHFRQYPWRFLHAAIDFREFTNGTSIALLRAPTGHCSRSKRRVPTSHPRRPAVPGLR